MRNRSSTLFRGIAAFWAVLGLTIAVAQPAGAQVTFAAASGTRAASAVFDVVSGNLQVTLANTSAFDVLVPVDVLTAVFFDITGNPLLSRFSGILTTGSAVLFGTTDPGGVVGGEWAYVNSASGAPGGARQGISSSGLGIFGSGNRFPGNDLQPPTDPDGLQYGITSAGDNPLTGNAPVTGSNALIKNSVTFALGALPQGFSLTQIGNVSFQYGTSLSEPFIPVPEPESYAMMLAGLGLLGFVARRRRRQDAAIWSGSPFTIHPSRFTFHLHDSPSPLRRLRSAGDTVCSSWLTN